MTRLEVDGIRSAAQELVGVELTEEAAGQLALYGNLLLKWNGVYNLTRIVDEQDVLEKHLLDAIAAIERMDIAEGARVLDVGSGSGVPGIVAAVLRPQWNLVLVDCVGKKVHFLKQAIMEMGLENAQALHTRIEDLKGDSFDAVLSRAFATLDKTVALTEGVLKPEGKWYAMKAKNPAEEIEALPAHVRAIRCEALRVPEALGERHLVVLQGTKG